MLGRRAVPQVPQDAARHELVHSLPAPGGCRVVKLAHLQSTVAGVHVYQRDRDGLQWADCVDVHASSRVEPKASSLLWQ